MDVVEMPPGKKNEVERMGTKEAYRIVAGLLRKQAEQDRRAGKKEVNESSGLIRPEFYWAFQSEQAASALEFFSTIAGTIVTSAWDNLFPGNLEAVNAFLSVTSAWGDYDKKAGQNYIVDGNKYSAFISSDRNANAFFEVSLDLVARFPKTLRKIGPAIDEWETSPLSTDDMISKHRGSRIGEALTRIENMHTKYGLRFRATDPVTPLP